MSENLDAKAKLELIEKQVKEWRNKEGHEQCWYYPDILAKIETILGLPYQEPIKVSWDEFGRGCARYREELYLGGQGQPQQITIERRPIE